jgi:hypothetical protein
MKGWYDDSSYRHVQDSVTFGYDESERVDTHNTFA